MSTFSLGRLFTHSPMFITAWVSWHHSSEGLGLPLVRSPQHSEKTPEPGTCSPSSSTSKDPHTQTHRSTLSAALTPCPCIHLFPIFPFITSLIMLLSLNLFAFFYRTVYFIAIVIFCLYEILKVCAEEPSLQFPLPLSRSFKQIILSR